MLDSSFVPVGILQNIGPWEVLLIFLVVLVLFGAKRLPELFRSFGQSIKEFKKATQDIHEEVQSAVDSGMKEDRPKKRELPATEVAQEKTTVSQEPEVVESKQS